MEQVNKQPSYKYNAEKNSVDEQPTIEPPEFGRHGLSFNQYSDIYENHLNSLKSFPVHGKVDWKDGQELIEGKDFTICTEEMQHQYENGEWARSYQEIDVAKPINKEDSNDIAKDLLEDFLCDYEDESGKYYRGDTVINILEKINSQSHAEEGKDAIEFAEWAFGDDINPFVWDMERQKWVQSCGNSTSWTTNQLYQLFIIQQQKAEIQTLSEYIQNIKHELDKRS